MLSIVVMTAIVIGLLMLASPYTMTAISDVPSSDSVKSLLAGERGRVLTEPALVQIAFNAEDVDITMGVTVGATEVLPAGSRVTLQATVGILPVLPDDVLVETFGNDGDEIVIGAANADAAASREARVVVKVTAIEDVDLARVVRQSAGAV